MAHHKVDLFLLGQKAEAVLTRILDDHGPDPIASVIAARDHSIADDRFAEIEALAKSASLPFYSRSESAAAGSEGTATSAMAVGWRWLIKRDYKPLIVLHDSLLPKYRGFNPLVSCLLNKEPEIGVTALIAVSDYDRGPILAQRAVKIMHPMRLADAIDRIMPLYAGIASQIVSDLSGDSLGTGTIQDESQASYSLWRDEDDYCIDWRWDADYIQRFIWALGQPYAGSKTLLGDRWVRIMDADVVEDVKIENRIPGKIIFMKDGIPTIVCGAGLLRVTVASYDDTKENALPLKQFRLRFGPKFI
jgi:methionyl-tRNA formyltransferase